METPARSPSARFGLARLGLLAACAVLGGLAALAGFAAPLRAQTPAQGAPANDRTARGPADRERWVRMLEHEAENPDAEIARSARAALDALGERGRGRGEGARDDRGAPRGRRSDGDPRGAEGRDASGTEFPPHPLGPRPPRPHGFGRDAGPRDGDDDRPRGPRGRFDGENAPPRCGPGCCLHGRGARDGGPPPFPRGVPPGPPPGGPRGPRDFAPRPPRDDGRRDRRTEPGSDGPRPPRPPLPDRDEPSRPHRSTPKEA